MLPVQAQDAVSPKPPPDNSSFKIWLCGEFNKGIRTPFDAKLQKECPRGVIERKFTCKAGAGNHGDVSGNCAEGVWEHVWDGYPYCSDIQFWCEWGGGRIVLSSG